MSRYRRLAFTLVPAGAAREFVTTLQGYGSREGIIRTMAAASHAKTLTAIALFTAALALRPAVAQLDGEYDPGLGSVEPEQPPVYEIEFLIFAYNEFNPLEEEFAPSKPKWTQPADAIRLTATPETLPPSSADWYLDSLTLPAIPEAAAAATADVAAGYDAAQAPQVPAATAYDDTGSLYPAQLAPTETAESSGTWYRFLEPDELTLGRALARLGALDAYTPLLHGGWSQPTLLEDEAIPLELSLFGQLQPSGSIRLHRSRFLHLTIDVSLQSDYRYRQVPIAPDAVWPLAEFVGPTKYTIRTQRRIRSGELHFFDHPAFGMLVIVRPAPEEEPATDATRAPQPAA